MRHPQPLENPGQPDRVSESLDPRGEDQVIRPDGHPGIYGVVETRIATGVVALDDQRQVYLVGQFRYATGEYSWEIIEGGSEESETVLAAAMRAS